MAMEIYQRIFEHTPDALLLVDHMGQITRVNVQAERMFGYDRAGLVGQAIEILIPQRFTRHGEYRTGYLAGPRTRPMGVGLELFGRRQDGSEFPVDIMLSPIETGRSASILCVVRDITERKRAEQQILDSLREKEVLLKEIHHRVKNNLAVISSLFYLQSQYPCDAQTIHILQESQDRVRSMALVHETLYRSENLAAVDFAEYAVALCEHLVRTYRLPTGDIQLQTDLETVKLNIDLAIPCGLILNEVITNALKHAFADGRGGIVRLTLHRIDAGAWVLCIADNGVGLPADLTLEHAASLGLRLIRLLTRQINGRFDLASTYPGTEARLTVREERYADKC